MSQSTHRIRRISWQVRAGTQSEALRVRAELNAAWSSLLEGQFSQTCDEVAPPDVVLRIPRLELNVKTSGAESIASTITEIVCVQLAEQLRLAREGLGHATDNPFAARETSASKDALEALLQYLGTGLLRWSASGHDTAEIASGMSRVARSNLTAVVRELAVRPTEHSWFRLLQLLDGNYTSLFSLLVSQSGHVKTTSAIPLLERLLASDSSSADAVLRAAASLVCGAFGGNTSRLTEKCAAVLRNMNPADQASAMKVLVAVTSEFSVAQKDELSQNNVATKQSASARTVERVAVTNAGLVLLHPFLPTLLSRIGLSTGTALPEESLPRAAALLHHIATGRTDVHEFELGLIKVFLGLTPETDLPVAQGLLSAEDIDESDAMIAAMINHWSAIGKTSVAGVRTTFLARAGMLALEDHGWTLHVDASPFDMLLDRLPWGYGVVRLPWMQKPLHTQWTQ
ncbi:MAG: contractile injection system tape measure protein [Gemmatimonadaceae bacterium]